MVRERIRRKLRPSPKELRGVVGLPAPEDFDLGNGDERERRVEDWGKSPHGRAEIRKRAVDRSKELRDRAYTVLQEDPERALGLFDEAIELDPKSAGLFLGKAHTLRRLGRDDEALEVLERALTKCKPTPHMIASINGEMGFICLDRRQPQNAIPHWEEAVRLEPNGKNIIHLGHSYFRAGDPWKALETYKSVPANSDEAANALACMAEVYFWEYPDNEKWGKNADEAERLAMIALELDPNETLALSVMTRIRYEGERFEEARDFAERGLDVVPDNRVLLEELADTTRKLGDYEGAIRIAGMLLELNPDSTKGLDCRGFAQVELGRNKGQPELFDTAEADFRRALGIDPDNKRAIRGMCYVNLRRGQLLRPHGRDDEARECFETAGRYLDRLVEIDADGSRTRINLELYEHLTGHPRKRDETSDSGSGK